MLCDGRTAGGDSAAEERILPHSGSQVARSSLQTPVFSGNRSSSWMRFGFSKSCGKLQGQPLSVRSLWCATLYAGKCMEFGSRHWHSSCHVAREWHRDGAGPAGSRWQNADGCVFLSVESGSSVISIKHKRWGTPLCLRWYQALSAPRWAHLSLVRSQMRTSTAM